MTVDGLLFVLSVVLLVAGLLVGFAQDRPVVGRRLLLAAVVAACAAMLTSVLL